MQTEPIVLFPLQHAIFVLWRTTHIAVYKWNLFCFHGNSGYATNVPQCYIIYTLPVL